MHPSYSYVCKPTKQYQQLIYVSSASLTSNNLNQNPYLQQPPQNMSGGGVGMPPQPPLPAMMHQNGPIYVSTQQQQQPQPPPQGPGIPNSASSNSVIYASQQIKPEQLGPQPPQPQSNNNYGQTNGHHQIDGVYGQIPVAPPINGINGSGNVPVPPPMMNIRGGAPVPPAPPAPPAMMGGGAPPPPPPPPMMAGGPPAPPAPPMKKEPDAAQDFMGSLAAQLQQAKLKKNKVGLLVLKNGLNLQYSFRTQRRSNLSKTAEVAHRVEIVLVTMAQSDGHPKEWFR